MGTAWYHIPYVDQASTTVRVDVAAYLGDMFIPTCCRAKQGQYGHFANIINSTCSGGPSTLLVCGTFS